MAAYWKSDNQLCPIGPIKSIYRMQWQTSLSELNFEHRLTPSATALAIIISWFCGDRSLFVLTAFCTG